MMLDIRDYLPPRALLRWTGRWKCSKCGGYVQKPPLSHCCGFLVVAEDYMEG